MNDVYLFINNCNQFVIIVDIVADVYEILSEFKFVEGLLTRKTVLLNAL